MQPGGFSGTDSGEFIICGIVGVAGKIFQKEEKVFRNLLVFDSVRGEDSTGVASVTKESDVYVAKELGHPFNLFESRRYEQILKRNNKVMIGHNRFATMGGVLKKTAHPFEFDSLVGVHNGTLTNKWRLADAMNYTVDSENLYHHIEKHGLDDALKIVEGAWCLVWWDKYEDTLNFLRNKERPMYLTYSDDGKTLLWASEKWMLQVACSRNDLKIGEIIELAPDMLHSFDIDKDAVLGKPRVRKAEGKPQPITVNQQGGAGTNANRWQQQIPTTQSTIPSNVTPINKGIGQGTQEKKTITPPTQEVSSDLKQSYTGSQRNHYEIVASRLDSNGARYIQLMDMKKPALPVRMYLKAKDPLANMVGTEIIADIASWCSTKKGEGCFFKASQFNVVVFPKEKESESSETDLTHMGAGRRLYTRKEWSEKYTNCFWCFNSTNPDDKGNRITPDGDCLCGDCCANLPEEFVGQKLVSVI